MERTSAIIAAAEDAADMRRRMGAAALETDRRRTVLGKRVAGLVAAGLPSHHWPQRRLLIPAIDAHTGEPLVFDRHSGVDLVDAVAASTSNGFGIPPTASATTDISTVATDAMRTLIWPPDTHGCWCCHHSAATRYPLDWGMHLATQVEELRARGSRVETIFPDSNSEHMFGENAMNLSLRPAAARAGYKQQGLADSSPNSGADAPRTNRLARRDDTCACLHGRWARRASPYVRAP